MTGSRVKRRRQQKQEALANALPFPLPSRYQVKIHHAQPQPNLTPNPTNENHHAQPTPTNDNENYHAQPTPTNNIHHAQPTPTNKTILLPASSNLAIPDPDYDGDGTPRYAAFRLSNMLSGLQRSHLRFRVQNVWKTRLRSHTIKSRGAGFHQWWFGTWTRYAQHAVISRDTRLQKSAPMVKRLLSSYDQILGSKTRSYLKGLDPSIAKSMGINHRAVSRHLRLIGNEVKAGSKAGKQKYKSWYRETFEHTRRYIWEHPRKDYRMGGMGTMMAVSWGEGTDWHKDSKDQRKSDFGLRELGAD
jgi:hypothetical protein